MKTFKRVRAEMIRIELPREGLEPWIHVVTQVVEKEQESGKVLNVIPRDDNIHRRLTEIGSSTITFSDPLLGGTVTLSGHGVAQAITEFCLLWMQERYGGEISEDHELIVTSGD